jgi:general stress protein CsbA
LSLLAASSASAIFWFTIPETYAFGSLTLLLALGIVALAPIHQLSSWWYVAVSALTLGITITNWMAGILATLVNHRLRKSVIITLEAFAVVTGLVLLQKLIFPAFNAGFLRLWSNVKDEATSTGVLVEAAGGPLYVLKCIIFDTIVMPAIAVVENSELFPHWSRMTIQVSPPLSGSIWGYIAVFSWIALLSLGVWAFCSLRQHGKFRIVLGLTLLGQIALHLLYGDETFLHSLHFLPLLVVLVALTTLTRMRLLALVLTGVLVLSAGVNNLEKFAQATDFTWGRSPWCEMTAVKCGDNAQTVPIPQ